MSITKNVPLKYIFQWKKIYKDSDQKIDFESQNFAFFDDFYSTHRKT